MAIVEVFNLADTPELAFRMPEDLALPADAIGVRSSEKSLIFGNIQLRSVRGRHAKNRPLPGAAEPVDQA
jgi:hypothetical protein